ncbi:MAG: branched-chain amino acid ABC transporter permease [Burkholderiales bacterium]
MRIGWNTMSLAGIALVGLGFMFGLPGRVETFTLVNITIYAIFATLALSLALVWGFGGILSFGQSAFFGLGGYAYAIAVVNIGESTLPIALGVVVPIVFAAILGYFMFWGRISDVYLAVITLVVSLILYHLVNSTSGSEYRIGAAPIGGHNGIPGLPPINVPGDPTQQVDFDGMYQLALGLVLLTYIGLRALLASRFGRVVVAIRENETRAALLGYDTRRYKLAVFMIGAGIAGIAGVLFANWGSFIGPNVFSIVFASQIIMWVLVGGLGTLGGAMLGAVIVHYLTTWIGESKIADSSLVLGFLFIVFVLMVPKGLQPMAADLLGKLSLRWKRAE